MASKDASGGLPLGRVAFDPLLIVAQIAVLQSIFYLALGALFYVMQGTFIPADPSLRLIFDYRQLSVATFTGIVAWGVHLMTAVAMAWAFNAVVCRSKRCLDHALTLYGMHTFLAATSYGFPRNVEYWLLVFGATTVLTLLSEYLCMKQELREIPLQNPDERHGQQASLVRQKEQEMRQRGGGDHRETESISPVAANPPSRSSEPTARAVATSPTLGPGS